MTKSKNSNREETRMDGIVARVVADKGFGFIKANGIDHFFHRSEVKNAKFDELEHGMPVTFTPADGDKGPRAEDVRVK